LSMCDTKDITRSERDTFMGIYFSGRKVPIKR
jgi:hypothetical protein